MREDHATAAVSTEAQCVQGVTLRVLGLQEANVSLPLVTNHLATREASHWDDHDSVGGVKREAKFCLCG